ncbi:restriction endonuclease subunit S [Microbispora catharanthi]|uniref:Type I restriction modification DNA specificity domain-containing protein n=1 Tax=Microbispora catharanthi TaxID=1712871 RepID=A0A5N6BZL5_9ACTN|nr:restriction endonuclease subunit S [Microbispora catharanthi]KAB8185975.1 hypothetical protein FH610_009455 [Microbispora catharanthi]
MNFPKSWDIRRSRFCVSLRDVRGEEAPLASATKDGVFLRGDLEISVWNPLSDTSSYKLVEPDDFVIGLRSFQHGISHSEVRGNVSPAYTVLRPGADVYAGYLKYYFRSSLLISQLANITQGIRQGQAIDIEAFRNLLLPVPPLWEQRRIADFLDAETARIDRIRNARLRQLSLIEEKLESTLYYKLVRSSAITVQLRRLGIRVTTGPFGTVFSASEYQFGGIPMINPVHIKNGEIVPDRNHAVSPAMAARLHRHLLRSGDLIVGRKGDIGQAAIVRPDQDGWVCGSDSIALHPNTEKVRSEYLAYALRSKFVRSQLLARSLATTMPSLSEGNLLSLEIPQLELHEQDRIIRSIDHVQAWKAKAVAAMQSQLSLLSERRQALITAAVTGQFDVASASGRGVGA